MAGNNLPFITHAHGNPWMGATSSACGLNFDYDQSTPQGFAMGAIYGAIASFGRDTTLPLATGPWIFAQWSLA
jgi:hypothetical protein